MKKLQLLIYLLLFIAVVPLTSCDDDDDAEPSRTVLLTTSQWTGNTIYVDDVDQTQSFRDKGMDIRTWKLKFNTDGSYTIQGDMLQPSPYTGTWEFTNNQQAILFDKNASNGSETAQINKLSSSELFLQMTLEDTQSGTMIEAEVRFKK
ncbi:hypothetical protein [Pontibacter vulgaris]|uniref:hypothetical protein n=1 Tax=Pontibacter vulgaris TaxID=2905679 RepID=UPI001FA809CA|nr:hypothetical protein [Pontibacter vulgaris]